MRITIWDAYWYAWNDTTQLYRSWRALKHFGRAIRAPTIKCLLPTRDWNNRSLRIASSLYSNSTTQNEKRLLPKPSKTLCHRRRVMLVLTN